MIVYLSTDFSKQETQVLHDYIYQCPSCDVSVAYFVNTDRLKGVSTPSRMLAVGGLLLCEEADNPGEWNMGQVEHGKFAFWANYGDLDTALHGL